MELDFLDEFLDIQIEQQETMETAFDGENRQGLAILVLPVDFTSLSVTVPSEGTVRKPNCFVSPLPRGVVKLTAREASGIMLLLINKDTGMGSGDEYEDIGIDIDVNERKAWSLAMSVRTVRALAMPSAKTRTLVLLKAWTSTMKLIH